MQILLITALLALATYVLGAIIYLRKNHAFHWLAWGAFFSNHRARTGTQKRHLIFTFVDHFEPKYFHPSPEIERERVKRWVDQYPRLAKQFKDSDGRSPIHTFFYPDEEYEEEYLNQLVGICRQGLGEIEVHLHHDHDTPEGLSQRLNNFTKILHERHGALPLHPATGKPAFAFIHGNWCLDNSAPDGRMCGVNNELIVLREAGCYADFTFPAAPDPSQPSTINSIYYAKDDPEAPKSHDKGIRVKIGPAPDADLMIIQGPLGFNWNWRKFWVFPRLDNADVRTVSPIIPNRIKHWVSKHIHVEGRPEWVFVKLHTHGAEERDVGALLGQSIVDGYQYLVEHYSNSADWDLHFMSAREMYNVIKAAESGKTGNPFEYRDFIIPRPNYHQ